MKKVLIGTVIVLLLILAYFIIFRGISIGSVKILSVEQIANENDNLTQEIAQTELLMKSTYQSKIAELESSVSKLLEKRTEYLDLANISTVGEIQGANQTEEYTTEFLLAKLGNYSGSKGVDLTYVISPITSADSTLRNISFKVTGLYGQVIEFISALEDDTSLGFRIYNFKMTGNEIVTATFITKNVRVKQGLGSTGNTQTSTDTQTNNQDNSNTENNLNTENDQDTKSTQEVQNVDTNFSVTENTVD